MTVEYFTPSERDIEQAPARLQFYKVWWDWIHDTDLLPDQPEMTIIDFSHLYTEEEMNFHRQWLAIDITPSPFGNSVWHDTARAKAMAKHALKNSPLRPLDNVSITEVSVTRGNESVKPKDFTPVAVQSALPAAQVNPNYRVKEVKTINGRNYTFYGQELPKDKK